MRRLRFLLIDVVLYAADACFWLESVCLRLSTWCKRTGRKMRGEQHE